MNTGRQRLAAAALWIAILTIGWFAYAPALGGTFLLDDVPNLSGLASVNDAASAVHFAFSGISGPLGRPLALATFVPQAAAWGISPEAFLKVNILIHLGNACILLWLLYQLNVAHRGRDHALIIAIVAAAAWLLMPLLASSSLLIIQRMTTLTGTFILLGIASYLWARRSIERGPAKSLLGMSLALVFGTALAILTKENGALLPTYVLAMEATLLRRPQRLNQRHWRAWQSLFLLLPTALIVGYLAWQFPYAQEIALKREFTAWERLLTESRILWEYLFNAFIPRAGQFGPFHDGYPAARTLLDPVTLLAFASCIAVLGFGVLWRRRYPLFGFAVLWFFGGHVLESTTLPLDLYFEHRNYLPIIGPVYALCAFVMRVTAHHRKQLAYAAIAAYLLISAGVLFGVTSLWGNPSVAFRYWQERFPDSMYSATALIRHELVVEGPQQGIRALHRLVEARPEAGYLKIHELKLSCELDPRRDHQASVVELDHLLKHVDFSYTALTMLSQLLEQTRLKKCNGVDSNTVRKLAHTLLNNPRYKNDARYNQLHQSLMALISQYEGNPDQAIRHLKKAIAYGPSADLNKLMVVTYAAANRFEAARAYIEEARLNVSYNPMRRYVWLKELDTLADYVDELELRLE